MSDDKYREGFTDVTGWSREEQERFLDEKIKEANDRDDEDEE